MGHNKCIVIGTAERQLLQRKVDSSSGVLKWRLRMIPFLLDDLPGVARPARPVRRLLLGTSCTFS
jgi:hypothetical protein